MISLTLVPLLAAAMPTDTSRYTFALTYQETAIRGTDSIAAQVGLTGLVTLITRPADGGVLAEFHLDSLSVTAGSTHPIALASDPQAARGARYTGRIVEGLLQGSFTTTTTHRQAALLTQALEALYPAIQGSVAAGSRWSDTAVVRTDGIVAQNRTTIASWQVSSVSGSTVVAHATTNGEGVVRQQSPAGERVDEVTMRGRREVEGPLRGPMSRAVTSSEQQRLTYLPGAVEPVPALIRTSSTFTRIP